MSDEISRVTGLSSLANDRFGVFDAGAGVLIAIDSASPTADTLARAGAGPGEVSSSSSGWMAHGPGDSLTVTDGGNDRVTILAADGSGSRSFNPRGGIAVGHAWMPSGSGFVSLRTRGSWKGIIRHDAAGGVLDTILTIQWTEPSLGTPAEPLMHLWGEQLVWAHDGGDRLAIAINTRPEVTLVDLSSGDTTLVVPELDPVELTATDRDAMINLWHQRAQLSDIPRSMAMRIKPVAPAFFPLISALAFTPSGLLLIQGPPNVSTLTVNDFTEELLWGFGGKEWLAFDEDGSPRGAIVFSERFRPLQPLSDGHLLGILMDSEVGGLPAITNIPENFFDSR